MLIILVMRMPIAATRKQNRQHATAMTTLKKENNLHIKHIKSKITFNNAIKMIKMIRSPTAIPSTA